MKGGTQTDDITIIQMFWDRDEKAIAATKEKYGHYCLSIAESILGNSEDAEECVNDAFLKTWDSIPPNKPSVLSAYIGKIVRNLSFNLYKRNNREKRGAGSIEPVLNELSDMIAGPNSTEDDFDGKIMSEAVNSFLSNLTEDKRKIFVCRYWYADSVKDISKRFGMTENSISVILNRLRIQLRNYLSERGIYL